MKFHTTLLIATFILTATGCSTKYNFPISNSLTFEITKEKLPLKTALYIPQESKNIEYTGTESAFGQTSNLHSPIGLSLEPNAITALQAVFENAVPVADTSKLPANVDVVTEITIIHTDHKYWTEGPTSCRTSLVRLSGTVSDLNRKVLLQLESEGEINCRKWQCEIKGAKEGMNQAWATFKALHFAIDSSDFKELWGLAASSALQMALEDMSQKLVASRHQLVTK